MNKIKLMKHKNILIIVFALLISLFIITTAVLLNHSRTISNSKADTIVTCKANGKDYPVDNINLGESCRQLGPGACPILYPDGGYSWSTVTNNCQIAVAANTSSINAISSIIMQPSTTLLINHQDTINAPQAILGSGLSNTNYHLIYLEFTGKGGPPIWNDGNLNLKTSSSKDGDTTQGTFQYTPTIPQPHASFYNPNAYGYVYTFIQSGYEKAFIGKNELEMGGIFEGFMQYINVKPLTCYLNM